MKKLLNATLITTMCLVMAACNSNVRHTLGLKRQVPDAFKVVANPPLSIPPEFTLPTPRPGAVLPEQDMSLHAQNTVFSVQNQLSNRPLSDADKKLLQRAKTNEADPHIIEILNQEQQEEEQKAEEKNIFEKMIGKVSPSEKKQPVVDAPKEKERITKNKLEGKSVSDGSTPDIDGNRNNGLLNRVFGL